MKSVKQKYVAAPPNLKAAIASDAKRIKRLQSSQLKRLYEMLFSACYCFDLLTNKNISTSSIFVKFEMFCQLFMRRALRVEQFFVCLNFCKNLILTISAHPSDEYR